MTAYFRFSWSSKERIITSVIVLFSLFTWHMPVTRAANAEIGEQKSLVFEINPDQLRLASENQNTEQRQNDLKLKKVHRKVELVREYLENKNAPLADYTEIILAQEDWKLILAISNAESNMGKRCYYNNCSGIYGRFDMGYAGLKKYETKAHWIVDLQNLLDRRYEGWTLDKMNGVYVYPRSQSWYAATSTVYNALDKIEKQVDKEFPSVKEI